MDHNLEESGGGWVGTVAKRKNNSNLGTGLLEKQMDKGSKDLSLLS